MEYEIEDITNYPELEDQIREKLSQSDKNRFVPMEERQDTSVLSVDVLASLCHGKTCMIVLLLVRVNRDKEVQYYISAL